jgi:molecular chaperone GrpE (heat shock protein)
MTGPDVARLLASFGDEVEETLERCGVAVSTHEPGGAFTPGLQQVASVVDTDDPARDGTVAGVVQDGYVEIDGGKVVVPARITVHRLTQTTKETIDG